MQTPRSENKKAKRRLMAPVLPQSGRDVELSESEAKHALQVLRLGNGDWVEVLDGKGSACLAQLRVRERRAYLVFENKIEKEQLSQGGEVLPIDVEVAILKGDAMEWVVEKCVELGVRSLTPLVTAHTVVQIDRKGPEAFRERWQRIADQALKQCGRLSSLEVLSPRPFEEHLAKTASVRRWVADENQAREAPLLLDRLRNDPDWRDGIRLLIGPEGGWSQRERDLLRTANFVAVSLGPLILRAETACLLAAGTVASFLRSEAGVSRV